MPTKQHTGNVSPEIDNEEHVHINDEAGKKVALLDPVGGTLIDARHMYGWDASSNTWRPIEIVESTVSAGHYVLAVGNIDGSAITGGGGTVTTSHILQEIGDSLLLENGSFLLLE